MRPRGFCRSKSSTMSCCWIGRGGNSARTSAARFRITWPRSCSGWASIDRTGWKPCAASVDYSSRRRADLAHSSMPRHAARGAGSRARRPLEPPLCRPLARHRALKRHLHDAFTRRARPAGALDLVARRRADRTGRTVLRLTSSDHARTMVILKSSVSDRLGGSESGCAGRFVRPTSSWVSESPTDKFMGV